MHRKAQHTKLVYQQKEECKEGTEDDKIDRNSLRLILSSVLCTLPYLVRERHRILMLTEGRNQWNKSLH